MSRPDPPQLATIVGADYSALALTPQASWRAPDVVRSCMARFAPWDARSGTDLGDWDVRDLGDAGAHDARTWETAVERIGALAARAHEEGGFVVGLGGDHSVSFPLVRAAAQARSGQRLGVVQLDVHHDVRPPVDGVPSNGSPFRLLLDSSVIAPSDLVQVGIHPFGNRREFTEYCDTQGVARIGVAELAELGAAQAATRALDALAAVDAIYLSVDIDVLDRAFAPGTAAALPGGLSPRELLVLVEAICADPRTCAMDVVEFDPERDVSNVTGYAAANVVVAALAAVARRSEPGE